MMPRTHTAAVMVYSETPTRLPASWPKSCSSLSLRTNTDECRNTRLGKTGTAVSQLSPRSRYMMCFEFPSRKDHLIKIAKGARSIYEFAERAVGRPHVEGMFVVATKHDHVGPL